MPLLDGVSGLWTRRGIDEGTVFWFSNEIDILLVDAAVDTEADIFFLLSAEFEEGIAGWDEPEVDRVEACEPGEAR